MKKTLASLIGAAALLVSVSSSVFAQTTLPQPSTTGAGVVARVTPPDGVTPDSNAASTPTTPGATGDSVVAGDNSTMRGDRAATYDQKSGSLNK